MMCNHVDRNTTGLCFARRSLASIIILLAMFFGRPIRADSLEEAKENTEQARDYINQGRYDEALSALRTAYNLKPSPLIMFNIAMCEKALSRHIEAISTFQNYFEMERKWRAVNPRLHSLAMTALEELYRLVGQLEIVDAPDGASITVDEKVVGTTPLNEPFYLLPGKHSVKVVKEGFATLDINVVITADAKIKVTADLERPLSQIQIVCREDDATIHIGDRQVGACPYSGELPPGTYDVEVTAPDKKKFTHQVNAEVGKTTVLAVELESERPQVSATFLKPSQPPFPNRKRVAGLAIGSAALGVVAMGIGIGLAGEYRDNLQDLESTNQLAIDAYNEKNNESENENKAWSQEKWADKDEAHQKEADLFPARSDRAKKYYIGSAVTCAVGGVLIATGAGLAVYYLIKRSGNQKGPTPRQEERTRKQGERTYNHGGRSDTVAVTPSINGFVIEF